MTMPSSGQLDDPTRVGIAEFRKLLPLGTGDTIDAVLDKKILALP